MYFRYIAWTKKSQMLYKPYNRWLSLLYFTRLQDEYGKLEEEIKKTIEESRIVQEKYKSMYEQGRKELTDIHTELDEVKSKVCTVSENLVHQYEWNNKSMEEKFENTTGVIRSCRSKDKRQTIVDKKLLRNLKIE